MLKKERENAGQSRSFVGWRAPNFSVTIFGLVVIFECRDGVNECRERKEWSMRDAFVMEFVNGRRAVQCLWKKWKQAKSGAV